VVCGKLAHGREEGSLRPSAHHHPNPAMRGGWERDSHQPVEWVQEVEEEPVQMDADEEENGDAKPEEFAAAAAGLEWGQVTPQQSEHFGLLDDASALRFLTIRNAILIKWNLDVTVTLTAQACGGYPLTLL
jgi:hypothetical protein